jgi:hypothetical protein
VVTICDHLGFLDRRELEHTIFRESAYITSHCLIEHFSPNAIDTREVCINDCSVTSNEKNTGFDVYHRPQ